MREYQSQQKNTSVKQINQFKIVYPFSKLCVMCVVFQINVMYVSWKCNNDLIQQKFKVCTSKSKNWNKEKIQGKKQKGNRWKILYNNINAT